jgi:hypothetical protein
MTFFALTHSVEKDWVLTVLSWSGSSYFELARPELPALQTVYENIFILWKIVSLHELRNEVEPCHGLVMWAPTLG